MKKLAIVMISVMMLVSTFGVAGCGGVEEPILTPTPESTPESTSKPPLTPAPTTTPIKTPETPISADIRMVSIPGSTFLMGDLSGEGSSNERPVHLVTLSPFSMSAYEISYAQWTKVKNWAEAYGYTFNETGGMGSAKSGGNQDENHPATGLEWYDAVLWCNAVSEMEGRTPCYYTSPSKSTVYRSGKLYIKNDWVKWDANGYRLPTEAEWEYACRAGIINKYSFGDTITGRDANYWNSGDEYDNGTTPVGNYTENTWGLYDMHGNVAEWCWDWYDRWYYETSPSNSPSGPWLESSRVLRGGSWTSSPESLRSAARFNQIPDQANVQTGFRPVRSQ